MALTRVKTAKEIEAMRRSGKILEHVLTELSKKVVIGETGKGIDAYARKLVADAGGKPTILGYQGFPASICVSVNDAVVHGIPDEIPFKDGDIVSLDFCVTFDGMITDAARTILVGTSHPQAHKVLLRQTDAALQAGIAELKDGVSVGTIAASIQKELDKAQLGIVRDLVGHGVGHEMHEDPNIPNYGHRDSGPVLKAGMTIAIEPMATLGMHQVFVDDDGWTIRTRDGSMAAHFEDTVLITPVGYEVLTRS
jgi:methionyl aminopeptidase